MQDKITAMIFGTGALSREAAYLLEEINICGLQEQYELIGFIAEKETEVGTRVDNYLVVCTDGQLEEVSSKYDKLALVIPMASPQIKSKIYQDVKHLSNCYFPNLIHPRVNTRNLRLGIGNIIQENVSVSIDVQLGDFTFINYGVFLGHDAKIGDFGVVNPKANICGNVTIEEKCLIGVGSTVLQNLTIGRESVVGASALVTKDVKEGQIMVGIPAKEIQRNKRD